MKKNKTLKIVIIAVVIFAALVLVYGLFFSGGLQQETGGGNLITSFTTDQILPDSGSVDSNILTVLQSVKQINLNDDVFVNPGFTTLIDKSIQLPEARSVGRAEIFSEPGSGSTTIELDELTNQN